MIATYCLCGGVLSRHAIATHVYTRMCRLCTRDCVCRIISLWQPEQNYKAEVKRYDSATTGHEYIQHGLQACRLAHTRLDWQALITLHSIQSFL